MSGSPLKTHLSIALLAAGLLLAAAPVAADEVGRVAAVAGSVQAEGPDGTRALACGDAVNAGERLIIGEGARLGVLSDALYAQIDGVGGASQVQAGLTDAGLPDWSLEAGRIRVVDTRGPDAAGAARLATPHAAARGVASDSEAYVLAEKAGAYSIVCEWGEPLAVTRMGDPDESLTAAPGECAVAKPGEPLYKAAAQEERMGLAGSDGCGMGGLAGVGSGATDLASRFGAPLPPVAMGFGGADGGLLPPAPPAFSRQPCDDPGACFGGFGSVVIPNGDFGVVESPAGSGSIPGVSD